MKTLRFSLRFALTCLILLAIEQKVRAQFQLSEIEYVRKVKDHVTYVTMTDTGSLKSKAFKDIFLKYWTYTKVEFINYSDINKHVAQGNSFLSIGGYVTSTQFVTVYNNGAQRNGIDFAKTYLYLEFWTVQDKFFEKKKKASELEDKDKILMGRVDLFTDFATLSTPSNIYKEEYDGGGHIRNWGLGYLKNYLQVLCTLIKNDTERWLYKSESNELKLNELKTQTLYVPDYVLIKFNKFTGDESEQHSESEIFEDYKYKYQLINNDSLNRKIMVSDEKPFYYLVYVKSCTEKFISVMNSATGEFIYTDYTAMSYNITSKDIKKLSSAIEK